MMQKILVVINDQLNNAFQGLEEGMYHYYLFYWFQLMTIVDHLAHIAEAKRYALIRLLVQPGKDPPPALRGYIPAEEASYRATQRSEQSPMSNVSTLMLCCCTMLTISYPFKVLYSSLKRRNRVPIYVTTIVNFVA